MLYESLKILIERRSQAGPVAGGAVRTAECKDGPQNKPEHGGIVPPGRFGGTTIALDSV